MVLLLMIKGFVDRVMNCIPHVQDSTNESPLQLGTNETTEISEDMYPNVAYIKGLTRVKILGQGSYGIVHQCRDTDGKIVVTKTLCSQSKYRHPYIVDSDIMEVVVPWALRGVDTVNTPITIALYPMKKCIVFPYYQYTLHSYVMTHPHMPLCDLVTIVDRMELAIAEMHNRGFTHGDVNWHNVLLNNPSDAVLNDFSLSQYIDKVRPHNYMLSPDCMSIEQMVGDSFIPDKNWRVSLDTWGIGMTILYCIQHLSGTRVIDPRDLKNLHIYLIRILGIPSYYSKGDQGYDIVKTIVPRRRYFEQFDDITEKMYSMLHTDPTKRPIFGIAASQCQKVEPTPSYPEVNYNSIIDTLPSLLKNNTKVLDTGVNIFNKYYQSLNQPSRCNEKFLIATVHACMYISDSFLRGNGSSVMAHYPKSLELQYITCKDVELFLCDILQYIDYDIISYIMS